MNTPATESHGFARRFEMVPSSPPAATVGNTICAAPNRRRSLNRRTIASQAAAYSSRESKSHHSVRSTVARRGLDTSLTHIDSPLRYAPSVSAVYTSPNAGGRDGGRGDRFAVDDGRDRGPQTRMCLGRSCWCRRSGRSPAAPVSGTVLRSSSSSPTIASSGNVSRIDSITVRWAARSASVTTSSSPLVSTSMSLRKRSFATRARRPAPRARRRRRARLCQPWHAPNAERV